MSDQNTAPAAPAEYTPSGLPGPDLAIDRPGLTPNAAEAKLTEMFKRNRGVTNEERTPDGRFARKDGQEPAQDAPAPRQAPDQRETPAGDSEGQDTAEVDEDGLPIRAADDDDDDAPAGSDGDGEELPEEVEFAIGEKKYVVPKPLVEGAMRQADYTKKTEEVAAERRVLAAERAASEFRQAVVQELAPALAQIQNTEQHIEQLRGQMPDPKVDPMGYLEFDKQLRGLTDGLQQLRDAVAKRGTELAQQEQSARAELLQSAYEATVKLVPKWSDESFRMQVAQFGVQQGYTPEELMNITDPRMIRLMRDAMSYRRLKDAKPDVRKKIADAPPVVKPGGANSQASQSRNEVASAKDRVRKTGRTADAEQAILSLLRSAKRR